MIERAVIEECHRLFPEAISEVEAVDLAAQNLYKEIRENFGITSSDNQLRISKYNYLKDLRAHLNNKRISELSSFVRNN